MPTTLETKYLGSLISWTTPPKIAIKHRVDLANASFLKIHDVGHSKLPRKTKSRVYHSSIVPALTYALDTCPLDKHQYRTLEGHYFRRLRRALKIKASYYSRISNYRVWKAAQKPSTPLATYLIPAVQLAHKVYDHSAGSATTPCHFFCGV